jgi:hypothetical protein
MSLLDDARRLAEGSGDPCGFCLGYEGSPGGLHAPDCPMHAVPRIVAVLEAAESLINEGITPTNYDDQHGAYCTFCSAPMPNMPHATDCPWQALVATLKGEQN